MSVRRFLRIVAIAALVAVSPVAALGAQSQEDETDAHGYDTMRIEQEDKLYVPAEIAEEVWNFLRQRFVDDVEYLRGLDPALTSRWSEELFHDTYYDTPSLQLYEMKSGVRHRSRVNLSDPDDRKSGRELMQIKLNSISGNPLERGELKYEIKRPETREDAEDSHPMLGIVKRSQRGPFVQRLTALGLDPVSMRPVLTVRDLRRRIYLLKDAKPFLSISFDETDSRVWWGTSHFHEIEPELNEIGFTEADAATRAYMETILHKVVGEIRARFPAIEQNLAPKYNKSFDRIEASVPFLRLLVRTGMQTVQGMWLFFAACALVLFVAYRLIRDARMRASQARARPAAAPVASGAP